MPRQTKKQQLESAAAATENVIIKDYGDDIRSELEDKFGSIENYSNISLYRLKPDGSKPGLRKYLQVPDIFDVQAEFGGGKYELFVQWKDTEGERQMQRFRFELEGEPIIPKYTPNPSQNGSENSTARITEGLNGKGDVIQVIKELRELGALGSEKQGSDESTKLILEAMKNMNSQTLETIKLLGAKSDDGLLKTLLTAALQKNGGELDTMLKYKELLDTGTGKSEDTIGALVSKAPELITAIAQLKSGPGAAGNPALQQIVQAIQDIDRRLTKIFKDYYEDEEPESIPDQETQTETTGEQNMQQQENPALRAVAEKIKVLNEDEKVEELKRNVVVFGISNVQNFCIKYGVVKDAAEFKTYMEKAGLIKVTEEAPVHGVVKDAADLPQ
jgi:hypothetical protein